MGKKVVVVLLSKGGEGWLFGSFLHIFEGAFVFCGFLV